MKFSNFKLLFSSLLLICFASCIKAGYADQCEISNRALEAMPKVTLSLKRGDGTEQSITALLANNGVTRAAGFQNICNSTVEKTLILFTFPTEIKPSFHMNNVLASLDIAFIKTDGTIASIQVMKPYSPMSINKPLYSPSVPVQAALEAHEGFFQKLNVREGDVVFWEMNTAQ